MRQMWRERERACAQKGKGKEGGGKEGGREKERHVERGGESQSAHAERDIDKYMHRENVKQQSKHILIFETFILNFRL